MDGNFADNIDEICKEVIRHGKCGDLVNEIMIEENPTKCLELCKEFKRLYECNSRNLLRCGTKIDFDLIRSLNEMRIEVDRRLIFVNELITTLKTKRI